MNAKQRKQAAKLGRRVLREHIIPMFEELATALETNEESPAECARIIREMIAMIAEHGASHEP